MFLNRLFIAVLAVVVIPAIAFGQNGHWVSAYYGGWQSSHLPPNEIDFGAFTHLLHFSIYPTGGSGFDGTANGMTPEHMTATVQATHAAGKKAILSVGGWGADFTDAVSPSRRAASIQNLVAYMRTYGYDGIDIDWEPVTDPGNFAPWIRDLRTAMLAYNPAAILTIAAFSYDQAVVTNQQYFDQINLMTYDMAGPWPGWVTWHNSPVYDGGYRFPSTGGLVPSANGSIDEYVAAGVPKGKLGIGIDFLGYYWTGGDGTPTGGVTAPRQAYTVTPEVRSNVQYYEIMDTYGGYPQLWDSSAQAVYISIDNPGSANDRFISFDNERTMYAKAEYVVDKGIGGVIVFELGAGYRPTEPAGQKDFLLQAVKKAFILGEPYIPDITPPTVSLTSPSNGAQVNGTITLSATASDNSGAVSVQFYLDDIPYRNPLRAAPFSTPLNTWKLTNGSHTVMAIARDRAGNADSSSALIQVNNQGTPPTVQPMIVYDEQLRAPFINSSWGSSVQFSNTDIVRSGSRSIKVDFLDWGALDFASGDWQNPIPIDPTVYDTLQFDIYPMSSFDLTVAFYNGSSTEHPVQGGMWNRVVVPLNFFDTFTRFYLQRDVEGASTSYFDNIMFTGFGGAPPVPARTPDTISPTVSIISPSKNALISGVFTLRASATDNIGVAGVHFLIDGAPLGQEKQSSPFAVPLNTWYQSNGDHTVTAIARDGSGNRDTASVMVTIHNQGVPPSFDLIVYEDGLESPFESASWGATVTDRSTNFVESGSYSARVDYTGWGAFDILSGTWGDLVPISPAEYDSLVFSVYPTSAFTLDVSFYMGNIYSFPLTQNKWNRISLPLDFDPSFTRFYFRRDIQGEATAYFDNIRFVAPVPATGTGADPQLPVDYALDQNYPNPFNPSTTIAFALPRAGNADLRVYDLLGREVATITQGELLAGTYRFRFDPSGEHHLASGVYFYRLQAGDFVETRKMVFMK